MSFKGVLGNYKKYSKVFQERIRGVSRKYQGNFKGVSKKFQVRLKAFQVVLRGYKNI